MALVDQNNHGKFAIELCDFSICFGPETVIEKSSLTIKEGECVVLIGPSGQGKSSLLKMLAGLIVPTTGKLNIFESEFHKIDEIERLGILLKMGILFQKNALFDSMTCIENVIFPLRERSLGENEEQRKKIAEEYLEKVGISHAANLFPDEISGGMQKRLGIARALALEPKLIFYDDPTAGLDPITSRKIIDLILSLKEKSKSTVVAVTNDMNRAYQMADRIVMVVNKGIIDLGTPNLAKETLNPIAQQFIKGLSRGPLTERSNWKI